jgi:hypothetical protein
MTDIILGIYSTMNPDFIEGPGHSYILANATMIDSVTTLDDSDVWESMTLHANDSTLYTNDSSTYTVSAQITLCMSTFEAQNLEIHATRSANTYSEPKISWNTSTASYNTTAVLQQLGAGGSHISNTERGVFNLTPRAWTWQNRPEFVALTGGVWSTTTALDGTKYAQRMYETMMSSEQYSLLAQMATITLNPALALQAFLSNLCAMAYYDRLVMFDTSAPSVQTQIVQVTRPIGWGGYIAVVSVLVFHLLLVLIITISFWTLAKLSQIGDAWATVSQLLSATYEWTGDMDEVDDKKVKRGLKERGQSESLVGIESVGGRVQIVRKDERA